MIGPVFNLPVSKEYIERGALLQHISCNPKIRFFKVSDADGFWISGNDTCDVIHDFPAADVVEVKHGKWVEKDCVSKSNRGRVIHYVTNKCSVCGEWNGRHKNNYCPNCGAKMDGGQ